MFIAFEGPDNVGKSTSAQRLDCAGQPDYQVTKIKHAQNVADWQGDSLMPHTYDRISWFSHMVYRLALPEREWHDAAIRTVFGMPDTHLVVKLFKPDTVIDYEVTDIDTRTGRETHTPIGRVNPAYWAATDFLMRLNSFQGHNLFRSISIIEVEKDQGCYLQRMVAHENPSWSHDHDPLLPRMVDSDNSLLEFLQDVEKQLG